MAEPVPSREQPSAGRSIAVSGTIDSQKILPAAVPSAVAGEAHKGVAGEAAGAAEAAGGADSGGRRSGGTAAG